MKLWRALALAAAGWSLLSLVYVFARRFAYPYDLEWMEGGMLCHALRLANHQPIYAAPSVDFVPYLYTPGYPAVVFALSKIFGLGYKLGRAVSLIGFFAAVVLGYVFARREGGSRAAAAAAMALPLAAFVPTGAWYDLARPDSLFLGLITAALLIGWWRRAHLDGGIVAALIMVAAFFVKQTAAPFMVALGLALLATSPRIAVVYGLTLAVVGLPSLYLEDRASGGWFFTYVSKLHRQHDFYPLRAFVGTPGRIFLLIGPGLLLVPWALVRRRSPGLVYASFMGLAGIVAACLGFGTQWAFTNAFMPGILLPAIAIGVAAGRLIDERPAVPGARPHPDTAPPRLRPTAVYLLLTLALACAPGGLDPWAARVLPPAWGLSGLKSTTGYDPRPFLPTAFDAETGDALIAKIRAVDGEVLIPFHPFYGYLAGKRTYLHRMGVLDIWRAGRGAPEGLADALRRQRFAVVVMDDKVDGNWDMWPNLLLRYHDAERLNGPGVVSGSATNPVHWMVPNVIDQELQ